ncbi:hypothetical protein [Streptomyces acidiscabies]|uniref:hypothetical protein n=1 Tax=Streptomyces acidiscabies TaxID=42234 RepID=UPI000AC0A716|nr:hypothetical protein [Streptomyces acidiscabies]
MFVDITTRVPLAGLRRLRIPLTYIMEIHGLGYILATADLPKVGPVLRLWLLPTVAGPWRTHIYSGASLDTAPPNGAKPVATEQAGG